MGCLKKEDLLTEEKLTTAFKMFDADGEGEISADEMKEILHLDERVI
jgi:Ca2+-binding EF-hand superfamily protein